MDLAKIHKEGMAKPLYLENAEVHQKIRSLKNTQQRAGCGYTQYV